MLLEALAGASYEQITDDYMIAYRNYYGITRESDPAKYEIIVDSVLDPMIRTMIGDETADLTSADLSAAAERYLLSGGMEPVRIAQLKHRLAP